MAGLVEARDDIEEGGLPRPRGPHHTDPFPPFDGKVHMVQGTDLTVVVLGHPPHDNQRRTLHPYSLLSAFIGITPTALLTGPRLPTVVTAQETARVTAAAAGWEDRQGLNKLRPPPR